MAEESVRVIRQIRTTRTSDKADLKHNLLLRSILVKPFTAMRFKIRDSGDRIHFHHVAVEQCYGNGSLGESISKLFEKRMFSVFGSRNSTDFGTLEKLLPVMPAPRVRPQYDPTRKLVVQLAMNSPLTDVGVAGVVSRDCNATTVFL